MRRIVPKTGLPTWWFSPHRHTLKEKACPDYKRALALKQKELEAQEKVERIERALAIHEKAIHEKERGDVAKEKKEDFVEVDLDAICDSIELPDKGMVLPKPRRVWKKLVQAKAKAEGSGRQAAKAKAEAAPATATAAPQQRQCYRRLGVMRKVKPASQWVARCRAYRDGYGGVCEIDGA